MPEFPDLLSITDAESAKKFADAAIQFFLTTQQTRERALTALYDQFNGKVKSKSKNFVLQQYGGKSSVDYVDYKLGRTKIKLLIGEYLSINLDPLVSTINSEAITEKLKKIQRKAAMMFLKEEIEAVRKETGFKVLGDMEIPDPEDPEVFEKLAPKQKFEKIMQVILEDKIESQNIKLRAKKAFSDLSIVSECGARIDTDVDGTDTIKLISPKNAIYQESEDDPFVEKSPFYGHREYMFVKDILAKWPSISDPNKSRLKELEQGNHEERVGWRNIGGVDAAPVYIIQFVVPKPEYWKTSKSNKSTVPYKRELSEKEWSKEVGSNDVGMVEYGSTKFEKLYTWEVWEVVRVGEDIFVKAEPLERKIIYEGSNGKYKAETDYEFCLSETIDGMRISIAELTYELTEVYNIIMYQIVREIKKMKGKVFVYDEAYKPKGEKLKKIIYDLSEHGILRVNSSEEGNEAQIGAVDQALTLIKDLDLGLSMSFNTLLELKNSIERTIDRITGINESREGLTKASQTATGAMQNIEASRSITKDIFAYHSVWMSRLLTKLIEKTKSNKDWLNGNAAKNLIGSMMMTYLDAVNDVQNFDYKVFLSDGKKEQEVRQNIRPYFDREINAGTLRTKDVIGFEMAKNVNEGLAILEKAWQEVSIIANQQTQIKEEGAAQREKANIEAAREDREDRQMHEKEKIQLEGEEKKDIERMKLAGKLQQDITKGVLNLAGKSEKQNKS